MKKYVNATADVRSRSRMSDDLDIEIKELIDYANQIAEHASELTDQGVEQVLQDVEKITSTLRRDLRIYF